MSPMVNIILTLVGLSVVTNGIQAVNLDFNSCNGTTVLSVNVPQCSCVVKRYQDVQFRVTFKAQHYSEKLRSTVSAFDPKFLHSEYFPETDSCAANLVEPPCPIVPNNIYTYTRNFQWGNHKPTGNYEFTLKAVDEHDMAIGCATKMNITIDRDI